MISYLKLIRIYIRLSIRKIAFFVESRMPWVRYSKFARDRNYLISRCRYNGYSENDKFANIGAGVYFYHPKWTNFDFYTNGESLFCKNFIPVNLLNIKKLPDSYRLLYCSHVFEHIPSKALDEFIKMIHRSMSNNSCLRIVVPDADLIYDAFKRRDNNFFAILNSKLPRGLSKEFEIEFLLLYMIGTKKAKENISNSYLLDIRNKFTSMDKNDFFDFIVDGIDENSADGMDHVNWFNFEKIENILKKNGFSNVRKSAFGQSFHPPMQEIPLFDGWLPRFSLYVEAEY